MSQRHESRQIEVCPYAPEHDAALERFMAKCVSVGYVNNGSRAALKIDSPLQPRFWVARDKSLGEIFAISGLHLFEGRGERARIAFRSCSLSEGALFREGLLKDWWLKSFIFNFILPRQVDYLEGLGVKDMIMSSNVNTAEGDDDKRVRMNKLLLPRLAAAGIVRAAERDVVYFGVHQNFWSLDIVKFRFSVRDAHTRLRPGIEIVNAGGGA